MIGKGLVIIPDPHHLSTVCAQKSGMHGGVETARVLEADFEVNHVNFLLTVLLPQIYGFYVHRSTAACVSLHAWAETQFWHGYMATYIIPLKPLIKLNNTWHCYTLKKYSTVILAGLALIIRK